MIEVKNLTKTYGEHVAISDLTFSIERGQIYGFLGPNGAGKSTTMNIITGCLAATSGDVTINGLDIFEDAEKAKKLIGYLPEEPPLYHEMTTYEYLDFVAKAKGVPKWQRSDQIYEIMQLTQTKQVAERLIKNLSKGYKQRVGIAQALIGNPEIIILDEPTVGLDPKQIIEIRDLIKNLGQTHTVILSSHILSEVRTLCDRIMIISRGKLVACDTPENLEKLFTGTTTIELTVKATEMEVRRALGPVPGIAEVVYTVSPENGTASVSITTEGNEDLSESVFFAFCDIRRPILRMSRASVSLEDVFIELTNEKKDSTLGALSGAKAHADEAGENPDQYENEDDNAANTMNENPDRTMEKQGNAGSLDQQAMEGTEE